MTSPTRCYPIGTLTPLLAIQRNAQSADPALGALSMTQWMEFFRLRVTQYVAPLRLGLRQPAPSLEELTEHALVSVAAQLERCTATTDDELVAWVSVRTTQAVLEHVAACRSAARASAPSRQPSRRGRGRAA